MFITLCSSTGLRSSLISLILIALRNFTPKEIRFLYPSSLYSLNLARLIWDRLHTLYFELGISPHWRVNTPEKPFSLEVIIPTV